MRLPPVKPIPKKRLDPRKYDIELAPKKLLADTAKKSPLKNSSDRNFKKVSPGKVKWHKDWAVAIAKSKLSRKPVLLFQLLGQLDDEFT